MAAYNEAACPNHAERARFLYREGTMMIIGVIGPETSLRILQKRSARFSVQLMPLAYRDFHEAIKLIEENERKCDALLFTGQTPYLYATSLLQPAVPWDFMPRNMLSTMCALVKAGLKYKNRIQNVSMDGFDDEIIEEIREELKGTEESVRLYNTRFDIMAEDYFQQVVQYHAENYRTGRADLCVTGLEKIYEKLRAMGIPSIKTGPNFSLLQQKLQFLLLRHQITVAERNLPAVVVIRPEFQLSREMHMYSELQTLRLQAQIGESVCYFAQHLGGAVFQTDMADYYVACDLRTLMAETGNFTGLSLLHMPFQNPCLEKISAGIGIGYTAREARYAADKAQQRSRRSPASCCYGLDERGHFFGPISLSGDPDAKGLFNENLRQISVQTGIGIRSLSKIEQALLQYRTDTVTSSELARYCSLSLRSMNRLLQKLEEFRYLTVLGKEPQAAAGRPRRILRIDLRYHD
ncbi:hypothetical protein RAH42_08275 [Pyramidobacter sp. YE332]|nr:hypothetical protein [Pyramidobacter sp. YE332]WOL39148.1 hypothetical protein RAH42_08275 [Pyramidobacter sp. YE332]